ncbi:phage major capsid protein [Clostridium botulinum]|uniref:phage major capsid protein n=1 Tax=Clostridium botulinum TaxID=1491 RepID=UPI00036C330A|nr:phage major capsid protein [Clostridium botulinum]
MKRLEDLLNQLDAAQVEAGALENSTDVDAIKACVSKIKTIKAQIELEKAKGEPESVNDDIGDEGQPANANVSEIFAKAIVGTATAEEISEIKNLMVEGDKAKGGVTVPDDVQTKIIELQRKKFDIRPYVNIEPVGTMKGSRPIEANEPDAVGFASVDEGKEIQAMHEPEYTDLDYNIRKYAGYIPITNELLEDSTENILSFIEKWMAKNELNTYAYKIFNGTGEKSAIGIMTEATKSDGVLKEAIKKIDATPNIKTFKTVLNKDLEDLDSDSISIFTNADGYDFIDGLEDKKGNPYLQPDVTKASGNKFLNKEIVKVPSKFLKNVLDGEVTRVPFIIGDLETLYTVYDRKQLSIESTNIGGEAWRKDQTEVKGVVRFDGKLVDTKAVKILLVDITKLV